MRPALILTTAAVLLAAGYFGLSRDGVRDPDEPNDDRDAAGAAMAQTSVDRQPVTAIDADDTSRVRSRAPRRPYLVRQPMRTRTPATVAKAAVASSLPAASPQPLPRQARLATGAANLPDASALRPATAAEVAARDAAERTGPGKTIGFMPQADPKDKRWIRELSGSRARLQMGRTKDDLSCGAARPCERPEASHDIKVVGVRVKAEQLVESPSTAVQGQLKRGDYRDGTPAVYVE